MAHGWRGVSDRSIRSPAMRLRARGDGVSPRASSSSVGGIKVRAAPPLGGRIGPGRMPSGAPPSGGFLRAGRAPRPRLKHTSRRCERLGAVISRQLARVGTVCAPAPARGHPRAASGRRRAAQSHRAAARRGKGLVSDLAPKPKRSAALGKSRRWPSSSATPGAASRRTPFT